MQRNRFYNGIVSEIKLYDFITVSKTKLLYLHKNSQAVLKKETTVLGYLLTGSYNVIILCKQFIYHANAKLS